MVLVDSNFLNRFGTIISTILAWSFTVLALPGMLIAFLIAGNLHNPSIALIIVTNSILYGAVTYRVLSRLRNDRSS